MKSSELRESFLKYFEKNGHQRIPSSSLVPVNDPTLFFTNAGMVPFKDLFLGKEKRAYKRAASSQKCMRVSGKHNDLENVGRTPRHHTFFEMLGNFSFGDYFKTEAIAYAWEYLTKIVRLPKDRLYITIFEDDDEAEKLWKKHVEGTRIFRMGEKDNFWAMGDTGPCGPCSEIHFDLGPLDAVRRTVRRTSFEDGRLMEVWNLVFMQYERSGDGKLHKLKKPSIDTGMGLERLAAVVAGVAGNYETDLFGPLITGIEKISKKKYQSDYSGKNHDDVSIRSIADHIRATVFLIGDGVQPSNEGRGYVLRRIIRRAARHAKFLKVDRSFFAELVPAVVDMMGIVYPELIQHRVFIEKVIANEEEKFHETLVMGLSKLDLAFADLKKNGKHVLPGRVVFELFDTFGFPKDLTGDVAREAGFTVDTDGFEALMDGQRERARAAWKGSGETAILEIYKELNRKGVQTPFVGYDEASAKVTILAMIKKGVIVQEAGQGDEISFVVDKTPFYGESGGQVGDTGMGVADGVEIQIKDTTKPLPTVITHHGIVKKGTVATGDKIVLAIDSDRRADITKNHTATHILHRSLRATLGDHVKQAGSLVAPDRLRFDFSHFAALTPEEISEIEADANRVVRMNFPVMIEELPYKEALARGALAFFGDKYGEKVRVVSVGDYSIELCGGAHVKRSGDIGMIKIISESSVASGVRRMEAVTGAGCEAYIRCLEKERMKLAALLKVSGEEVPLRVAKIIEEAKEMKRELEKTRSRLLTGGNDSSEIETVNGIKVGIKFLDGVDPKELRTLADNLRSRVGSGTVMLVTESGGKTSILIAVTKDLLNRLSAGDLMKELVKTIGGTGGGRPDMAQGGGGTIGHFETLKSKFKEIIQGINK